MLWYQRYAIFKVLYILKIPNTSKMHPQLQSCISFQSHSRDALHIKLKRILTAEKK